MLLSVNVNWVCELDLCEQGRPLRVHEYTIVSPLLPEHDAFVLKRMFSASSSFLNFENRTIIKKDMVKNVSEGLLCYSISDETDADLCVTQPPWGGGVLPK